MKHTFIATLATVLLYTTPAHATKPCMPPDEAWFAQNVIKRSDVLVYGQLLDFSDAKEEQEQWSKLHVIAPLFGKSPHSENILIRGWQAKLEPIFNYNKGDYFLLWLNESGKDYVITDMSWGHCMPAIWPATADKTVHNKFTGELWTLEQVQTFNSGMPIKK